MVHIIVISQKTMDIKILSVKSLIFLVTIALTFCYESPVIINIHMLLLQYDSSVKIVTIVLYCHSYSWIKCCTTALYKRLRSRCKVCYDSPDFSLRKPWFVLLRNLCNSLQIWYLFEVKQGLFYRKSIEYKPKTTEIESQE